MHKWMNKHTNAEVNRWMHECKNEWMNHLIIILIK